MSQPLDPVPSHDLIDVEASVLQELQPLQDRVGRLERKQAASARATANLAVLIDELEATANAFASACARIRCQLEDVASSA